MIIINETQKKQLEGGQVVKVVNLETQSFIKVALINGELRSVVSSLEPYSKVIEYQSEQDIVLRLTEQETKLLNEKHTIKVYRSSGARNEKDEPLTRKEQIEQGIARVITLNKDTSGVIHIMSDNSNTYGDKFEYKVF